MPAQQFEMLFKNSLNQIIEYANLSETKKSKVDKNINEYLYLKEKSSSSDEARRLRKAATESFCLLYKNVFRESLTTKTPLPVVLFLLFGYVSESEFTFNEITILLKLTKEIGSSKNVFTFYEWLRKIQSGELEPSINNFSMDYAAYLREQVKMGEITKEESKLLLNDNDKKVDFELDNVFLSSMKMMSSSVLSFCPILTKESFQKTIDSSFLNKSKMDDAVQKISSIDYSLFYRDFLYANTKIGVEKAFIKTEILPNTILMPCAGTKGVMWQEIEGANRQTPARFFFPIFMMGDLNLAVTQTCGSYRWEMCKRAEGARWMDPAAHSLTSDYYDYVTNYKSNTELAKETKEKVKVEIDKNGKNPKGVFLANYVTYISNESDGSIRLNKVARRLLFEHCPFSISILEGPIKQNALYSQILEKYRIKRGSSQHLFSMVLQKVRKVTEDIPKELSDYEVFLTL